ncbi:isoflavone 3'-hydroxylase-like [Carex rostrata]
MLDLQAILVSIALLIAFVKFVLSYTNTRKLPPSPPALPFIGHLYLFKRPLHQTLARISQRYGPITFLRFGSRPVYVISSPLLAEECFTTHDLALANRPQLLSAKQSDGNVIGIGNANYGPYWRSIRKIAAVELLSAQQLHGSSNVRAREIEDMARQLFNSWKTGCIGSKGKNGMKKLELKRSLYRLSLNVFMTMIAGKRFSGDNTKDMEETERFREVVEEVSALSGASNIEDFVPILRFLDLNRVIKKKAHLIKQQLEMIQKLIEEHRTNSVETKKTIIADLLELQKNDPDGYSDKIIRNISQSMILAGTDTSSNTMVWVMANLLNNPHVLKKAAAEIDKHIGNERLITESDIAQVPYLGCILSEVLRLYTGVPLLLPHESREDVTIGGYNIPQGTMVLVNVYHIHRDPDIWEEPEKFKPERFENGKAEGKFMIPFGMGRRRCPGEGLAMRQIGLIIGTLIQCFDWERTTNELVDLSEGSGLTLPKAVPLEAMYQPREAMMKDEGYWIPLSLPVACMRVRRTVFWIKQGTYHFN